jgi:hypothetical protein
MTTVTTKKIFSKRAGVTGPWGNAWVQKYHFETDASGIYQNSDQATAIQIADVVNLGILPAGLEIFDLQNIISTAFAANETVDLGFAYVDGVDVTATPQSGTFFAATQVVSSAAVLRKTGTGAPVTLPKDAYLTLTNRGAAASQVGVLDIVVWGTWHGSPSAIPT